MTADVGDRYGFGISVDEGDTDEGDGHETTVTDE